MFPKKMIHGRMIGLVPIILLFIIGLIIIAMNSYWYVKGISSVDSIRMTSELKVKELKNLSKKTIITENQLPLPSVGDMYGHLLIPKLDSKIPIFYGAEEDQLKKGIGHVQGTPFPGENSNTVLSGHRDTVFRHLGKIEKGDRLIIEMDANIFTYVVKKIRIVDENEPTVIVPKPRSTLTVITCYPFGYLGNAPQRFVLIADLIDKG